MNLFGHHLIATPTFLQPSSAPVRPHAGTAKPSKPAAGTNAPAANDGYISEYRELWGPDGRLIALNHQIVVVIK